MFRNKIYSSFSGACVIRTWGIVDAWEKLDEGGRTTISAAQQIPGGRKSTLHEYSGRFKREVAHKALAALENVELPVAVMRAITQIKTR